MSLSLGGPLFIEANSAALIGFGTLNLWEPHSKPPRSYSLGGAW